MGGKWFHEPVIQIQEQQRQKELHRNQAVETMRTTHPKRCARQVYQNGRQYNEGNQSVHKITVVQKIIVDYPSIGRGLRSARDPWRGKHI